jgi:hypothetical protein
MNSFELIDALVEFIGQNTSELTRFRYSERTETRDAVIAPNVFAGFVPRNEVGEVDPTGVKRYPAIIVSFLGVDPPSDDVWEYEIANIQLTIGIFDDNKDQQGWRDCVLLAERIDDRIREQSILRQRFILQMPIKWGINKWNTHPYWFASMGLSFSLPVPTSQFAVNAHTGDTLGGMYDERARPDTKERPTPYLDRPHNR